jgi:hypothetical protein
MWIREESEKSKGIFVTNERWTDFFRFPFKESSLDANYHFLVNEKWKSSSISKTLKKQTQNEKLKMRNKEKMRKETFLTTKRYTLISFVSFHSSVHAKSLIINFWHMKKDIRVELRKTRKHLQLKRTKKKRKKRRMRDWNREKSRNVPSTFD